MLWGYNYWSSSCWCWQNMPSLNKSYVSAHSFTLVTVSPSASFKVVWRPRLFCLLGQVGGSWVSSLGFGAKSWTFPWLLKLCIHKDHILTLLLPRQLRCMAPEPEAEERQFPSQLNSLAFILQIHFPDKHLFPPLLYYFAPAHTDQSLPVICQSLPVICSNTYHTTHNLNRGVWIWWCCCVE